MSFGFRLCYHRSVPPGDLPAVLEHLEARKRLFLGLGSYATGGFCKNSFFRRGVFGDSLGACGATVRYTFRRLSKDRRVFGVVPIGLLERVDGAPLELDQCMCALHRGGQRVRLKGGFLEEDFVLFFETGVIKG